MTDWTYNGNPVTPEDLEGHKAFVYLITNTLNGKKYYGKKRLHFTTHKRLKSKKRRIKIVKSSDWVDYYGSSKSLAIDIEKFGKENFKREILMFCERLSQSNYYELYYQMVNHVLLKPDLYYNDYVGGRVSRMQLGVK